ncbi:MAG TPA: flagellar hook capping FlgD N-terminal domain-containing protein [Baekduia sp.]|uniref:flagellar hook assembly protein FlgD n=1 Tax=Baekduia sp. TaxID=2600305 RepID=UPI002CB417D0|nr:flagellar hook capping FlgD N-terminal domain-containing protein [Baekduia sp.]HMJ37896.1 flagellar hook capping FlgD N-terminal domain-containing protein [Baekduia sp.]
MSSTSGIDNTYTNPAYQVGDKTPSSSLDKNGFLKMLTEQIKNQDPTSGQDPNQYFQTISQMTTVEQLTNLAQQSVTQLAQAANSNATSLIGRTVSYIGKDGLPVSGVVDAVDLTGKTGPRLSVAGVAGIDPTVLTTVK